MKKMHKINLVSTANNLNKDTSYLVTTCHHNNVTPDCSIYPDQSLPSSQPLYWQSDYWVLQQFDIHQTERPATLTWPITSFFTLTLLSVWLWAVTAMCIHQADRPAAVNLTNHCLLHNHFTESLITGCYSNMTCTKQRDQHYLIWPITSFFTTLYWV